MRYLFTFMCVLALSVMGCETTSTDGGGGSSRTAGDGGGGGGGMGDVFPCSERGILDAIAEGGGPHTFACDEGQAIETEGTIFIDNDVILHGEGVTLDGRNVEDIFRVVERVTVELNGFTLIGGGHAALYNIGTLTLANSTVTEGPGWGIDNDGALTVINSTVSGNGGQGESDTPAQIFNEGSLVLINSTVVADSVFVSALRTGPVRGDRDYLTRIEGTLILGRCTLEQPVTSSGYNIESPGDTCGLDQGSDLVDASFESLELGPLENNGGPTQTHALGEGSIAIDVVPGADCEVETDQRGFPRYSMCDVGAFEVQTPFSCTEQGILDAIAEGGGPHTFACDEGQAIETEGTIFIDNDVILHGEGVTLDGRNVEDIFRVVERVTVELNGFTLIGGGHAALYNIGTLTLANSTVTEGPGWGIDNDGALTVINSTVSGNGGQGESDTPAQIFNEGSLVLINSTVVADSVFVSALRTGPVRGDRDYLTRIEGTLILGRCTLEQPVTSSGYNIESPGDTCGLDQGSDLVDASFESLELGPLENNGGPTQTHALGEGSIAIDVVPGADCEVETDQRGFPRYSMCDVGSVEVQP